MNGQQKAKALLEIFIKNAGSRDKAMELIEQHIEGELDEFSSWRQLDDIYMAYGNGEAIFYVDNEEEPYTLHVSHYSDFNPVFLWD